MSARSELAPVVLFVYNRSSHTQNTIEALQKNTLASESDLFIFSDGQREESDRDRVKEVRDYIKSIDGFNKIVCVERETNWGLSNSIVDGITKVVEKYEKVIVLEDDIHTSPNFLSYMNEALVTFENEKKIFSIAGYNPPITIPEQYEFDAYFSYRFLCWGWSTWADRWSEIDWQLTDFNEFIKDRQAQKMFNRSGNDQTRMLKLQKRGIIDSWDTTTAYSQFKNDGLSLVPVNSKVQNTGCDGSGSHVSSTNRYHVDIHSGLEKYGFNYPSEMVVENELYLSFRKFFDLSPLRKLLFASRSKMRYLKKNLRNVFGR